MRSTRYMILVHLLVNALLLGLGYYWLGVGESRTSLLMWSGFLVIVLTGVGFWAYSAAFVYFGEGENRQAKQAWSTAFRHLAPLLVAAVPVAFLYWLVAHWTDAGSKPPLKTAAFRVASWLTLTFRKPVRPSSIASIFNVALWLIRWMVLPVALLPMASAISARGWSGFRSDTARVSEWRYWLAVPVLLAGTFWLPLWLVRWVPHVSGFWTQSTSFVIRATVAYLLFGASWLLLARITSRGKPSLTQSSTVASP